MWGRDFFFFPLLGKPDILTSPVFSHWPVLPLPSHPGSHGDLGLFGALFSCYADHIAYSSKHTWKFSLLNFIKNVMSGRVSWAKEWEDICFFALKSTRLWTAVLNVCKAALAELRKNPLAAQTFPGLICGVEGGEGGFTFVWNFGCFYFCLCPLPALPTLTSGVLGCDVSEPWAALPVFTWGPVVGVLRLGGSTSPVGYCQPDHSGRPDGIWGFLLPHRPWDPGFQK